MRFRVPLYTIREAALYLGIPPRTFAHWVRGNGHKGLVSTVKGTTLRSATIPFVGLAEGAVIAAFRRVDKLPLKYIRRVLEVLNAELGIDNALASRRLYRHGGQILFDHSSEVGGTKVLAEIVTKNLAFNEVVQGGLKLITYAPDDYAERVTLPATPKPLVVADPYRASGKPITLQGGIRVVDIIDRFRGRESPTFIAKDFGIEEGDVLDIVRAFYCRFEEAA